MPQGRRKTPFSGKAKKEQLKTKKQLKSHGADFKKTLILNHPENDEGDTEVQKINYQPSKSRDENKYVFKFHKESESDIKKHKELAYGSLDVAAETDFEINGDDYFPKELDFPKRPPWSYDMSHDQLEAKEQRYFREYVRNIERQFNWKELSYFELNLETWRQLWRVLEMSDIILLITDTRYPALMFPPSLYHYVTEIVKKDMILILNKIDLVPASVVTAWKNYFKEKYPELHILMFTTLPGYNLVNKQCDKGGLQIRRRKGRIRMAAEGTQLLFDACKGIVGDSLDLTSWQEKIKEECSAEYDIDDKVDIGEVIAKKASSEYYSYDKYSNGILTIGCVGQPNVGKSSLMNAIMGKKVVSVSKTPGHTKHFQTIFLTSNVRLCDCPGLIFPSKVPKVLQVLMGSFPIAQLREPYTTIKFLAEHIDLPMLLRITHPTNDDEWSAMDICDAWAKKRGYFTAKAARLDTYRAANNILRMALDGKICLNLKPPNYFQKKSYWSKHPYNETVKWIQAVGGEESENIAVDYEVDSSEEERIGEVGSSDEVESCSSEAEQLLNTRTSNKFTLLGNEI